MGYATEDKNKQKDSCTHRYLADREHIERQQDDIKKQRKILQEIDGQVFADLVQSKKQLEKYAFVRNTRLQQMVAFMQSDISYSQGQNQQNFALSDNDLIVELRKLNDQLDDREQAYKEEMRDLDAKLSAQPEARIL